MLTAKLQNRSGVLNRFTGVLSRRQVNIESISVGTTENPEVSRITIIIDVASLAEVEQIIKQLIQMQTSFVLVSAMLHYLLLQQLSTL